MGRDKKRQSNGKSNGKGRKRVAASTSSSSSSSSGASRKRKVSKKVKKKVVVESSSGEDDEDDFEEERKSNKRGRGSKSLTKAKKIKTGSRRSSRATKVVSYAEDGNEEASGKEDEDDWA